MAASTNCSPPELLCCIADIPWLSMFIHWEQRSKLTEARRSYNQRGVAHAPAKIDMMRARYVACRRGCAIDRTLAFSQAKRRAKIKADPELYQAQLLKDWERKKHQREAQRKTMSEEQLQEHQLKERLRVKNYWSKKSMKPMSSTNQGTPYRSRQALGKAIKQLEHGLPSSPHKQHFVVKKLARSVGVPACSTYKKSASAESKRELVHSFYRTDDISWQAPGRKIASSFMKQQRRERGLRQPRKFTTWWCHYEKPTTSS